MTKTEKTLSTVIAGLTRNLLPIIATLFLFLPGAGTNAQAQAQALPLPSEQLLSTQLPSMSYLRTARLANIPTPGITTVGRELLFAPPPPTETGNGGGSAIGEAPVTDVLWLLIFCCLVYGLICRNQDERKNYELRINKQQSNN
jgi:hypothetical protein